MESIAFNSQFAGSTPAPRTGWGDYSSMSVDPSDDCTFWDSQEYYNKKNGGGKAAIGPLTWSLLSLRAAGRPGNLGPRQNGNATVVTTGRNRPTLRVVRVLLSSPDRWLRCCARGERGKSKNRTTVTACDRSSSGNTAAGCGMRILPSFA
jgi:hypothetical protein